MDQVFGIVGDLTPAQECARAVAIFAFGLVLVRIAGRRIFGRWSALDIIVSVIIGANLSRALTGTAEFGGTLAATLVLVGLHWGLGVLVARSAVLSRWIEGAAVPLARDGAAFTPDLHRHFVSRADLEEALRAAGLEHVGDTRLVVLEPSGRISVLRA